MPDDERRTDDDFALARVLMETDDPDELFHRVFAYYQDKDRADRTPRETLYLHIGLLCGMFFRSRGPAS